MKKSFTSKTMLLFLALNLLFFGIILVVLTQVSIHSKTSSTEEMMNTILSDKIETLGERLKAIENEASNLACLSGEYSDKFTDISGFDEKYYLDDRGVLEGTSEKSSAYLPNNIPLTDDIRREIISTENLENILANISDNNNFTSTYIITASGSMRVYPYLDNNVFDADHDQRKDLFYQIASPKKDPKREPKWTAPYYDYAGKGWIITCSCPYYKGNEFLGVVCIDVDMQKEFVSREIGESITFREMGEWDRWLPFHDRLDDIVIPNNVKLLEYFRKNDLIVTFGRIACLRPDGEDRTPVQKTEGWNGIFLYVNTPEAEMIDELAPRPEEIVVNKTTDSVVAGTNYSRIIRNLGIETVVVTGIVTDQCVASTVRGLADDGFKVICVEDACAAACMELHDAELKIMNNLYCNVLSTEQTIEVLEGNLK